MKRRFLIALTVAVALTGALAGGVYAYFTTGGSGSGAASVGTAQAVTVQAVATGTPASSLQPGGSADLLVQLSNPNSYTVTLVGIAQNGTVTPVPSGTCTGANAGVTVPTLAGLTISVASGVHVVDIPGGAAMGASSASACQGASFQIPVTVTVQR